MSMIRIVIGTFIGVVLAVFVLYLGFSYMAWRDLHHALPPPPAAPVNFQDKMLRQGYRRDHITHRWYSVWALAITNECGASGPPLETTFHCMRPLKESDGIPDQR